MLKRLSETGLMENFIKLIQVSARNNAQVSGFLSPVVVIFGAASYFAGLLTRKVLPSEQEEYYLYFCGKGGQLLRWIPQGDKMVEELFNAGVAGPNSASRGSSAAVRISKYPKEEVGRGLLIERALQVGSRGNGTVGMFSEAEATVTVAEEGYGELHWNGELGYQELGTIRSALPPVERLAELNNFVDSFAASALTSSIAECHGFKEIIKSRLYRNTLQQRISDNVIGGRDKALIEPLFITEAKVLVEVMTGQDNLFE
jgi:hypothetical protein